MVLTTFCAGTAQTRSLLMTGLCASGGVTGAGAAMQWRWCLGAEEEARGIGRSLVAKTYHPAKLARSCPSCNDGQPDAGTLSGPPGEGGVAASVAGAAPRLV